MKIYIHNKDILDVTEADAIVLPVDGRGPGLEGNIARRFMRHVDVDEICDLYDLAPAYPFNGGCQWGDIAGMFPNTHFRFICGLGVLSHEQGANHQGILRSALHTMFNEASRIAGVNTLACPVLSAGWRTPPVDALYTMLGEAERFRSSDLELHIAELDSDRYATFKTIVG